MNIIEPIQALIASGVEHALTLWPEWQFPIVDLPARQACSACRATGSPCPHSLPTLVNSVTQGDKGVENRSWPIPAKYIGKRIALHWGAHIGGRKGNEARLEGCRSMLSMAKLAGWSRADSTALGPWSVALIRDGVTKIFDADNLVLGAIGCVVEITGLTRPPALRVTADRYTEYTADPYYTGEWGWRFNLVERLTTPIPCKGAQGLWPLRSLLGEAVGTPRAGRAWS